MAYYTTQRYKDNIYSENAEHSLEIKFGDIIIDNDFIRDFSLDDDVFVNKCFSLGSATICKIKLTLDNDIDLPLKMSSRLNITYKLLFDDETTEKIPLGTFIVTKVENKNDFETEYILNDKMFLFDVPYDASQYIPCTRYQLLKHICEDIGVPLENSYIINGSKNVEVYDSNLTARNYLSYISERACGYAKLIRDKLKIVSFEDLTPIEIPQTTVSEYTQDEVKIVTKVVYANGSQLFEAGNENGYIVYLDSNSIFTCTQEEIDAIFNALNGLQFQSSNLQMWGDPSIDTGDLIKIGNMQTFAQKKWRFGNGFYGSYLSDLSGISSKDSTQKISTKTKIKKLQSTLDEHEGKFKVISQEQDNLDGRLSTIELDLDNISASVSKTEEIVNSTVEKFRVNLESNNIVVSVDNSNKPHETTNYDINYDVFFMGKKIDCKPITEDEKTGIVLTIDENYVRFAVDKDISIFALDNKYTFKFSYTDSNNNTYELYKTIMLSLVLQGQDGKDSAIQSDVESEDKTLMWLDTTMNQLKRYNGETWEVVNDFSHEIDSINSSINDLDASIQDKLHNLENEVNRVITEFETKYTQNNNSFAWEINETLKTIKDKTGELEEKVIEQSEYMKFEAGVGLVIGKSTSPYTLVSKDDGIEIRYNNVPISFWNGDTFKVTRLMLGNFAFTPRDNGSLDFGKVVN